MPNADSAGLGRPGSSGKLWNLVIESVIAFGKYRIKVLFSCADICSKVNFRKAVCKNYHARHKCCEFAHWDYFSWTRVFG